MTIGAGKPIQLSQIAAVCDGELVGDPNAVVTEPASLESATANTLTFVAKKIAADHGFAPGAVLVTKEQSDLFTCHRIIVADPYLAYAKASVLFLPESKSPGIHPTALVDESAVVGEGVYIGPKVVIGPSVVIGSRTAIGANTVIEGYCDIGEDCQLDSSVVIYQNVQLGRRCSIAAGVVLGSSGFGYAPEGKSWRKIHQLGGVLVGDDVDIGANSTIDCGTLGDTVIGHRVKLDNMIHIAHNVSVGDDTIMAARVGIAGSATIGKRCQIGGRCSIVGHITIVDDTVLHALAFVTKSITKPGHFSSAVPAQPVGQWRKTIAHLNRLDKLAKKIKNFGNGNE